jgi:NADH dehydrogenase FAD-containing subunit
MTSRVDRRRLFEALSGGVAGLVAAAAVALALLAQGHIDAMAPLGGGSSLGWLTYLLASTVVGVVYGLAYRYQPGRVVAALAGGLLFGLLWWGLAWLTIVPLASGMIPGWSVAMAAMTFPQLVGSIFFGGLMAIVFHSLCSVLAGDAAGVRAIDTGTMEPTHRVVIVGGGFGGVAAAQRMERLLAHRPGVSVTLVSQSNHLLFTPMLAEVASGMLVPRHVAVPIRVACPRTTFRAAVAEEIDPEARTVTVRPVTGGHTEQLPYHELVLAAGSVPAFRGLPGLDEHALTLKSLADAAAIHQHIITTLERAEAERDVVARGRLLRFVVAGGGFAGVETVAEIRDLVHGAIVQYPHIDPAELDFVLVHSRERILPELSEELGLYARARLERRGVEFRLGHRLAAADADGVSLADGTRIPTATFIWTAGNEPAAAARSIVPDGAAAALSTDASLRVVGLQHVWAVGDCARIPDPDHIDGHCPPTAQHALRQGKLAGENVVAALDGKAAKPFRFRTLGTLVVLGHNTAAAEIRGRRFSGLLAWLMWRAIYLSKLPGFERKTRVLVDWALDLVFPRDIVVVQTGPASAGAGDPDEMASTAAGVAP